MTWEIPHLMQMLTGKIIACTARDIVNDSESLPDQVSTLSVGAMQTSISEFILFTRGHVDIFRSWRCHLFHR